MQCILWETNWKHPSSFEKDMQKEVKISRDSGKACWPAWKLQSETNELCETVFAGEVK